MMENSKALSQETKDLYKSITMQAKQFNAAYENMVKEIRTLERDRTALNEHSEMLTTQVHSSVKKLEEFAKAAIEKLTLRVNKTNQLYNSLDDIDKLRRSLEQIKANLLKQTDDVSNVFNEFNSKASHELESTLVNIKSKIESELEKEAEKIEVRLTLKMKQLETKVATYDKRILNTSEEQKTSAKQLASEIDSNQKKLNIIRTEIEAIRKQLVGKTSEHEKKIDKLSEIIDKTNYKLTTRMDRLAGLEQSGELKAERPASAPTSNRRSDDYDSLGGPSEEGGIFSLFDENAEEVTKAPEKAASSIVELEARIQQLEDKEISDRWKGSLAFIMSGISIVGLILVVILVMV